VGQIARCFYYFFMIAVVIRYKTKATARRALTFIVRIFVNDAIAIAVWTSFHVCIEIERSHTVNPTRGIKLSRQAGVYRSHQHIGLILPATTWQAPPPIIPMEPLMQPIPERPPPAEV
jgi:hypothetical protein